jgi:hypothetical protein
MAVKTIETKAAEAIHNAIANHYFNPAIMARQLVTNQGYYNIEKIMEMVIEIIKHVDIQFENIWEDGFTSEGLMWAARLNDMIENFEPIPG